MNEKENNNRNKLKEKKPKVLEKILKYPNVPRLQWQLTYRCNFGCSFCSIDKIKDDSRDLLSMEQIKKLFDDVDAIGVSRITLTGGEPLVLGKKLDDIIKVIDPSRFWLQLDSNAFLLTEEKVKHLKDIGIDCIAPSLDSLDFDSHDHFRDVEGSAEKVIRAFDYIQKEGLSTFVQTIVGKTRLYSKEFKKFLTYFNERDIGVYVGFCKPVGAYEGNFDELVDKKDIDYLESLEKEYNVFSHLTPGYGQNKERNCVASKNIFAVSAYGDVFPCIFFFASMGNALEEPLQTILDRCQKLKPFNTNTCPLADKSNSFIRKYLVSKIYGKKLPVPYKEVFEKEDFE